MVMKQPVRRTYRTANGKHVDLDLLISRNELTPAVGNAKVNARGDELGAGGKIVRKREDVLRDYYDSQNGVIDEPAKKAPVVDEPQQPVPAPAAKPSRAKNKLEATTDPWEEDEHGNFKKKDS